MSRFPAPRAVDVLVVVLVLAQLAELFLGRPGDASVAMVALVLIATGALLMRRPLPYAAVLVALAGQAALVQLQPHGLSTTFLALLATMVVLGTLARGPAVLALLGAIVLAAESAFLDRLGGGVADFALTLGVVGGAWTCGFLLARGLEALRRARDDVLDAEELRRTAAETAVREERERMTRELHDVVAHALTVLVVQSIAAQQDLDDGAASERVAQRLRATEEVAREALVELRTLLGILGAGEESTPTRTGLPAVEALVRRLAESGFAVDLDVEGDTSDRGHGLELTLYRVVQEGLTNAVKHGDGEGARVSVAMGEGAVDVLVENGVRPGGPLVPGSHRGLEGLRARVEQQGGRLAARRADDRFRLECHLPVTDHARSTVS